MADKASEPSCGVDVAENQRNRIQKNARYGQATMWGSAKPRAAWSLLDRHRRRIVDRSEQQFCGSWTLERKSGPVRRIEPDWPFCAKPNNNNIFTKHPKNPSRGGSNIGRLEKKLSYILSYTFGTTRVTPLF
jgi:hypothetical protein